MDVRHRYTHHLTQRAKQALAAEALELPLLSLGYHACGSEQVE